LNWGKNQLRDENGKGTVVEDGVVVGLVWGCEGRRKGRRKNMLFGWSRAAFII